MTSTDDTLIIVTADHGHVFTIGSGFPVRGNPILGDTIVVLAEKLYNYFSLIFFCGYVIVTVAHPIRKTQNLR